MSLVASNPADSLNWGDPGPEVRTIRVVPARVIWIVTTSQVVAAAGYAALWLFGEAPAPFSLADWTLMLLPPLIFGVLFTVGLIIAGLTKRSAWRLAVTMLGSLVCMCGLVVSLLVLPLMLFGSFMDYAIG